MQIIDTFYKDRRLFLEIEDGINEVGKDNGFYEGIRLNFNEGIYDEGTIILVNNILKNKNRMELIERMLK